MAKNWVIILVIVACSVSFLVGCNGDEEDVAQVSAIEIVEDRPRGFAPTRIEDPTPVQPLWVTEGQFANLVPSGAETTDGVLATALLELGSSPEIVMMRDAYVPPQFTGGEWIYPSTTPELGETFMALFIEGFENDMLSQVMPFNAAFLYEILQDVNFYFAFQPARFMLTPPGSAALNLRHPQIFVATGGWGNTDRRWFVILSIHEVAHVLGLNESLAELFTEEFIGVPHSAWGPNFQNHSSVLRGVSLHRNVNNLFYDSTFDRTLLRTLEAQGMANVFWYAAFHSNEKYRELWDEHMLEYITFDNLQKARTVYIEAVGYLPEDGGNEMLATRIQNIFGKDANNVAQTLLDTWRIFTSYNTFFEHRDFEYTNEERAEAFELFGSIIEEFLALADEFNLEPKVAVFDNVIRHHQIRFDGRE